MCVYIPAYKPDYNKLQRQKCKRTHVIHKGEAKNTKRIFKLMSQKQNDSVMAIIKEKTNSFTKHNKEPSRMSNKTPYNTKEDLMCPEWE